MDFGFKNKYKFVMPCNTNNSKLNETKDQFRTLSTKCSHSEPLMAPKLPTLQIFKGRAYELKYHAYQFCLNKKQANLLLYLRVIFSKPEKNYYIPEVCKNSNITPLRMHQKHNHWIHFTLIFLCVAETHAILLLLHMFL